MKIDKYIEDSAKKCLTDAAKQFDVSQLADNGSALHLLLHFVKEIDEGYAEHFVETKAFQIGCTLSDIGMKLFPSQFGEWAEVSTKSIPCDPSENMEVPPEYNEAMQALFHFKKASEYFGLPADYWVKRKDLSYNLSENPSKIIAVGRPDKQYDPSYRPPRIELNHERQYLLTPEQVRKLWYLVDVSCSEDDKQRRNQYYGRASSKSETRAAIRQFARKVGIDKDFLESSGGLKHPWQTIVNILAIVRCEPDTGVVQQVVEGEKGKASK